MNEQAESMNTSRVLAILRDARQHLEDIEKRQHEPIAIVGMACRLPADITSPESFWCLLRNGGTAVRAIPKERLNEAYFPSGGPDERQSGWQAGMLEGVDRFDAEFFGISRREAASMDPQQRLLLEVSWEALENAGQRSDRLEHLHTGVYVGAMAGDYGGPVQGARPLWRRRLSRHRNRPQLDFRQDLVPPRTPWSEHGRLCRLCVIARDRPFGLPSVAHR